MMRMFSTADFLFVREVGFPVCGGLERGSWVLARGLGFGFGEGGGEGGSVPQASQTR